MQALLLVKRLPVVLAPGREQPEIELQYLVAAELKRLGFRVIDQEEGFQLTRDEAKNMMPKDRAGAEKMMDKIKEDPLFLMKEMEKRPPYLQRVVVGLCGDSIANCVTITRYNAPQLNKSRKWEFRFDPEEDAQRLVSSVIDSLTIQ